MQGDFNTKLFIKIEINEITWEWTVRDEQNMELMTTFNNELAKKLAVPSFANAQRILKEKYPNEASA